MAAAVLIGFLVVLVSTSLGQHLGSDIGSLSYPAGICSGAYSNALQSLRRLKESMKNCVVVLGNFRIMLLEKAASSDFANISFPNLREITGFLALYRVAGLESVGQLFPNLVRIGGSQLINNYALIVHDMPVLREVGLYNLLKIDRGGVFVWGGPHTCFVDTIDWNAIAPGSRHMIKYPEITAHCNNMKPCKCGPKGSNYCWNIKRCQRFISEPRKHICHGECLGCTSDHNTCDLCRHFTHQGRCISQCPPRTVVLPDIQYCITTEECGSLGGWTWNNTCVFDCPANYEQNEDNDTLTCVPCLSCKKVCQSLTIESLSGVQHADKCVYINGSLIIHLRSIPGAAAELTKYLKFIETVADYVYIYGSATITSLDFLPSLRKISGRVLKSEVYSFVVHNMKNLQELFPSSVIKELKIDRGKLKVMNNPKLCMSEINEFKKKFPLLSNENEIPPGLNGYSGSCEGTLGLKVDILNETTVSVTFTPHNDSNVEYTVLYAKVPSQPFLSFVPEKCSESEWFAVHTSKGEVLLTSLHPAATYALCIETFVYYENPFKSYLTRSQIVNFTMHFNKPEPPFIQELVATSPNGVDIQWLDHRDYRQHITSYQLDATLIEIPSKDIMLRDHCNRHYNYDIKEDFNRHAVVFKPPVEYGSCKTNCKKHTVVPERLMEDHFDICRSFESDCNQYEDAPPKNSSFETYVKTLSLNLFKVNLGPMKLFHIDGLAPFRDYKIRLRACAENKCSRSNRAVIRTLRSNKADIPSMVYITVVDTGEIFVKWEPPDETNGPVFAYQVEVLSGGVERNETIPKVWCVYPEETSLIVKLQVSKDYQVRVCSSTLGSLSACGDWMRIPIPEHNYHVSVFLVAGLIFSITLIVTSVIIGFYKNRRNSSDIVPLVDITSMYRSESDPPVAMFRDFMPLYSVPFNDALIDYY